jgi:hypothetical protein
MEQPKFGAYNMEQPKFGAYNFYCAGDWAVKKEKMMPFLPMGYASNSWVDKKQVFFISLLKMSIQRSFTNNEV